MPLHSTDASEECERLRQKVAELEAAALPTTALSPDADRAPSISGNTATYTRGFTFADLAASQQSEQWYLAVDYDDSGNLKPGRHPQPSQAAPQQGDAEVTAKNIGNDTINKIVRAFWRRAHRYAAQYGTELPTPIPFELRCHMATALSWIEMDAKAAAPQPTGGESRAAFAVPDNLDSHREAWQSALHRLIELEPDADDQLHHEHELKAMQDMYTDFDRLHALRAIETKQRL